MRSLSFIPLYDTSLQCDLLGLWAFMQSKSTYTTMYIGALVVMKTHCTCDCKQAPTWCKQRVTAEETETQGTAGMLQCCLQFGYLVSEAIWLRKVVCPIHRYLSTAAQWGLMTLYIAVLINTQLRLPLRQAVGYVCVCVCVCVIDSTYYQRSAQRQQRVAS